MEWWYLFAVLLGGLMFLMLMGLPVAFSFLSVSLVGLAMLIGGEAAANQLVRSIFDSLTKFSLTAIPFFVVMGEVFFHSGLANRTLDVLDKWLGAIPGRLSVLTLLGGGLFASLSGSAVANTGMLGALMAPEMIKRGYSKQMTVGPILGSGALAMVIPPSALAVLLGSLAEVSIGTLLIAALLPGFLLLLLFLLYTVGLCLWKPELAPKYRVENVSLRAKVVITLRDLLPVVSVILLVLGCIFFGLTTPTEAAALGAVAVFLLVAAYGKLNWLCLKNTVTGSIKVTAMIFTIIAGSNAFSQILAFSGVSRGLIQTILSVEAAPVAILLIMLGIVIALGCIMEQVSIMMITVPMFMPIVHALGFDPIWFTVLVLIALEIGQLTPPVGLALFVMKGVAPDNISMGDIYKAAIPFVCCNLVSLVILIIFPHLVTWLPGLIR